MAQSIAQAINTSETNAAPCRVTAAVRRDPSRAPAGVAAHGLPSRTVIPMCALRTIWFSPIIILAPYQRSFRHGRTHPPGFYGLGGARRGAFTQHPCPVGPHFLYHCGMMAKGIVVPRGTNGAFRAAADTRCIGKARKAPWPIGARQGPSQHPRGYEKCGLGPSLIGDSQTVTRHSGTTQWFGFRENLPTPKGNRTFHQQDHPQLR